MPLAIQLKLLAIHFLNKHYSNFIWPPKKKNLCRLRISNNFTGNLVQQTQEEIIDISSLKSGFYIFKVYIDREILTKKVIKI